jgi:hypothetical protein
MASPKELGISCAYKSRGKSLLTKNDTFDGLCLWEVQVELTCKSYGICLPPLLKKSYFTFLSSYLHSSKMSLVHSLAQLIAKNLLIHFPCAEESGFSNSRTHMALSGFYGLVQTEKS